MITYQIKMNEVFSETGYYMYLKKDGTITYKPSLLFRMRNFFSPEKK